MRRRTFENFENDPLFLIGFECNQRDSNARFYTSGFLIERAHLGHWALIYRLIFLTLISNSLSFLNLKFDFPLQSAARDKWSPPHLRFFASVTLRAYLTPCC